MGTDKILIFHSDYKKLTTLIISLSHHEPYFIAQSINYKLFKKNNILYLKVLICFIPDF